MFLKLLAVPIFGYIVLMTVLWGAQERLALPGPNRLLPDPVRMGFENGERVTLTAGDGTPLSGWYLPPETGAGLPAPALLWFYGNMETVGVLADVFMGMKPAEVGLLAMDYRGYGENGGRATETDIERDAEVAWAYLKSRPEVDSARIAVYGRSVGSTVAMHLASKFPVSAVVLDSPMSSAQDVAAEHYWFFPRFLVTLSLDNVGRAAKVEAPLLVLHGDRDRIVPDWMGKAVAEAAPKGRFVSLSGANHNTTYGDFERYRETVWNFLGY